MVKRIGTTQRKTRHKLSRHYKERGKVSLTRYFQEFKIGDKVNLKIHPSIAIGRFFSRFHGLTGTVTGTRGACYEIHINDGGKEKTVYVHPIHLLK